MNKKIAPHHFVLKYSAISNKLTYLHNTELKVVGGDFYFFFLSCISLLDRKTMASF